MTYDEVIKYIKSLPPFIPKKTTDGKPLFDLEAVSRLASRFDDPQNKLKCVHIAGTNGKGSVAEFLSEILFKSGYRVGTFTSPYLKDIREQTKVNGDIITEEDFADVFSEVIEASERQISEGHTVPSEFEMDVVMSFLYFLKCGCDICIIEAGLGGEFDATNIINNPLLCVFTPVSRDHEIVLGDSLESIAKIKSGIIKKGCSCISCRQETCVLNVLLKKADENGSDLKVAEEPGNVTSGISGVSFRCCFEGKTETFEIRTSGSYQAGNAALAIAAAEKLKSSGLADISIDTIKKALLNVKRPGRFEILSRDPVVIADGAHNPAGVTAMLDSLKDIFHERYLGGKGFVFVAGVLADKDYEEMLKPVIPHVYKVFTVTPENVRSMPAEKLAEVFSCLGADAQAVENVNEALSKAKSLGVERDIPVVIFGSLYYMGNVREISGGV